MVTLNFGSAHHYLLSVRITGVFHHTQFYTLCQGSDPGLQACWASVLSAELGSYVLRPSHQSAFSVPAVYLCRLQCDGNRMVDGIFECLPPCGNSHLLFPHGFPRATSFSRVLNSIPFSECTLFIYPCTFWRAAWLFSNFGSFKSSFIGVHGHAFFWAIQFQFTRYLNTWKHYCGSYDETVFCLIRNWWTIFQDIFQGCTDLHSHLQWTRAHVALNSHQHVCSQCFGFWPIW